MSKKNRPQIRKQNLVEQEVDGELLIYDLESDKALCLNKTSAIVWQACDGTRTIAEINDVLGKQLKARTHEDIVWLALDQLNREKLIDKSVDFKSKFNGMSRREVIKKVGLSSVVTLPIVASLVAPTALHAQTGACSLPCFCPSGTSSDCNGNAPGPDCTTSPVSPNCKCAGPFTPGGPMGDIIGMCMLP